MGWLHKITVEPAMFLMQVGDTLTYVIFQNLFIDKICKVQLNYDDKTCKLYESLDGDLTPSEQFLIPIMKNIQEKSSTFVLYNSLVENSLPVLLVLFLGVWSDTTRRRKPCLLLSLVGKLFRSLGLLLNSIFIHWHPWILLATVSLPQSIGGGNGVFHMAAFSYIADSSVPRNRTWRLGIAEAFWQLGSPIGLFLGAFLFEKAGYVCVFSTAVVFHFVAVLYTLFILPEVPQPRASIYSVGKYGSCGATTGLAPPPPPSRIRAFSENAKGDFESIGGGPLTEDEQEGGTSGFPQAQESLLSYTRSTTAQVQMNGEAAGMASHGVIDFLVGSLAAIVKPRPNHTRKCLLSLGLIMMLYVTLNHGEVNMKYLYTRNRFQWREQEFTYWTVFDTGMLVVGLTVVLPLFSKVLRFSDPFAGAVAAFGRVVSRLCIAWAPKSLFLYVGSAIDMAGVLGPLSTRSLASKCVLRDERGKVFAFLGCIEALVPLLAVPLYSMIYANTLATAPATIYYVSAGICAVIFLIFSALFVAAKLNVIELSGTDTSSLTNPQPLDREGDFFYQTYRRFSLS